MPADPGSRRTPVRDAVRPAAPDAGLLDAPLPELMARLGHSTPAAALVYLHARSDRDEALTQALSAAMRTRIDD